MNDREKYNELSKKAFDAMHELRDAFEEYVEKKKVIDFSQEDTPVCVCFKNDYDWETGGNYYNVDHIEYDGSEAAIVTEDEDIFYQDRIDIEGINYLFECALELEENSEEE